MEAKGGVTLPLTSENAINTFRTDAFYNNYTLNDRKKLLIPAYIHTLDLKHTCLGFW